ncbi:hypothetical protein DM75_3339 [Burkholderia mallei]|nr:hypothetical protein DM75_3339 [Burkholderia mallei]
MCVKRMRSPTWRNSVGGGRQRRSGRTPAG